MPYLTWFPPSPGDGTAPLDPCLAIAWGHTLQVVVVSVPNNDTSAAPVFSQVPNIGITILPNTSTQHRMARARSLSWRGIAQVAP